MVQFGSRLLAEVCSMMYSPIRDDVVSLMILLRAIFFFASNITSELASD